MTIAEDKQLLTPGRRVHLFDFDASNISGPVYYFVSTKEENESITWKGNVYTPLPIEARGFEVTGSGKLPRPSLRLSNILLLPGAIINEIGDPLGAKITRWVTFEKYLDGQPSADPNQHFLEEVYYINRKVAQNAIYVEFELASSMDQQGKKLPGRQVVKNTCLQRYRYWDPETESFVQLTCPYVGTNYFNDKDEPVSDPSQDSCRQLVSSCKLRFPNDPLPMWAFPSVAEVRY